MFRQACIAGVSPLDFDRMDMRQVKGAVEGFHDRIKLQAKIGDALVYKVIRGCAFDKPRLIPFDRLFPQWADQEKNTARSSEEIAQTNRRRLDEWCDVIED